MTALFCCCWRFVFDAAPPLPLLAYHPPFSLLFEFCWCCYWRVGVFLLLLLLARCPAEAEARGGLFDFAWNWRSDRRLFENRKFSINAIFTLSVGARCYVRCCCVSCCCVSCCLLLLLLSSLLLLLACFFVVIVIFPCYRPNYLRKKSIVKPFMRSRTTCSKH